MTEPDSPLVVSSARTKGKGCKLNLGVFFPSCHQGSLISLFFEGSWRIILQEHQRALSTLDAGCWAPRTCMGWVVASSPWLDPRSLSKLGYKVICLTDSVKMSLCNKACLCPEQALSKSFLFKCGFGDPFICRSSKAVLRAVQCSTGESLNNCACMTVSTQIT